jgi:hypothetical protein
MKKIIVSIILLLFCFSISLAQETHFGIKAGYNSASVAVDGEPDLDAKSGLHLGGLAHIHISEHFAVQPELVYSMQGGEAGNTKLKLNYLNLPVLVQYMIDNGFRLQMGPQLGFLLSAKAKSGNIEIDIDDTYSSLDFSLAFGAGYLFPVGIGIDARFNLGISNISDDNSFEARNRVFQVGLFYQFMSTTTKIKRK